MSPVRRNLDVKRAQTVNISTEIANQTIFEEGSVVSTSNVTNSSRSRRLQGHDFWIYDHSKHGSFTPLKPRKIEG